MSLADYIFWYPPAETRIPLNCLVRAVLPTAIDFEQDLGQYLGNGSYVLAKSGRVLLTMLLQHLGRQDRGRDEVLLPGYTCYSVAASVVRAGFRIRLYDLDPQTIGPDLDSVSSGINDRTLAVITQHLCGIPTPQDEVLSIAHAVGAILIEDAAQGLGGSYRGRPLGMAGDFGLFSFGRGKPLPLGVGGALVSRDATQLHEVVLDRAPIGIVDIMKTAAVRILAQPCFYGMMEALPLGLGNTIFDPDFEIGPMPRTIRRLGKAMFGVLETINDHRREIAARYRDELDAAVMIFIRDDVQPAFPRYPILVDSGVIPPPLRRLGVRRMYPQALADVATIKPHLASGCSSTPGAAYIARALVTLPTHTGITPVIADRIIRTLKEVYAC